MSNCFCALKVFNCVKETKVGKIIQSHLAFAPPSKINYYIKAELNECRTFYQKCFSKVIFEHKIYKNKNYPWIQEKAYEITKSGEINNKIIMIYLENIWNKDINKNVIVFSHGNACDLSSIYPLLIDMCTQLKADVISYDYSGYGRSEGSPCEQHLFTDIENIIDFTIEQFNISEENIIL
jgi:pimeloyl-ACP methyl ester carboxylesterase